MESNETVFPQKYAENRARFRTAYVTLLYDVCLDVICESAGRPTHPVVKRSWLNSRQTTSCG
jgi:hypothetical protein